MFVLLLIQARMSNSQSRIGVPNSGKKEIGTREASEAGNTCEASGKEESAVTGTGTGKEDTLEASGDETG
jgi:hypothetical protein